MSYSLSPRKRLAMQSLLALALIGAPMTATTTLAQAQETTTLAAPDVATMPWLDATKSAEWRTTQLMLAMTEDEKIHMLHGAGNLIGGRSINKDHPKSIGYVPAIPRLRVPALVMTDGPAGLRNTEKATVLPAPIVQAASFDPDVAKAAGQAIAQDSKDRGQDLLFGPGFNLARNPRAGRTFEYFGEDPYLAGVMAAANVNGLQGEGIMANLKHFVANSQETNRTLNSSNIDERTLHEIYEKPFQIAIEESDPASVMCAYNKVNNLPACGNPDTLVRDLRLGMKFEGFVVTDYPAAHSPEDIKNGLNIELPGADHTTGKKIRQSIQDGRMTWDDVNARVKETLTQMFRFGMFDHEWDPVYNDRVRELKDIDPARGDAVALETAVKGSVLLKNHNNVLPLHSDGPQAPKRVLIVGNASKKAMMGGGSSMGSPIVQDSAYDEIVKRFPNSEIVFKSEWDPMGIWIEARKADMTIVFADQISTELIDRPNLDLLPHMTNALNIAANHSKKMVVVTQAGGPILMPWLDKVDAVLNVWYPGQAGGRATAKLLFGEENPSGRLPQTFPRANGHFPAAQGRQFPGSDWGFQANYDEGVFIGYRWYETRGIGTKLDHIAANTMDPLFPFGYGLSYTTFEYGKAQILTKNPKVGELIDVQVTVTNTGDRPGSVVPQLYVSKPQPEEFGVHMPSFELVNFKKIQLNAGESKTVIMTAKARDLAYYNTKNTYVDSDDEWTITPGQYTFSVRDNATDVKSTLATTISE